MRICPCIEKCIQNILCTVIRPNMKAIRPLYCKEDRKECYMKHKKPSFFCIVRHGSILWGVSRAILEQTDENKKLFFVNWDARTAGRYIEIERPILLQKRYGGGWTSS